MDVVGHYGEGMQVIVVKPVSSLQNGPCHDAGDFRPSQVKRAGAGVVQKAIHGYEGLSVGQGDWGEETVRRHAALQTPSKEEGASVRVPVRQAGVGIAAYNQIALAGRTNSHRFLQRREPG